MNEDFMLRIAERFSVEELAEVALITNFMFIQAFEDEILDNLERLAELDAAFILTEEEEE
mgnify:CR=1 FL=1|jgi:hypothetical protein|tara:strand:+ start:576 stop:755 length:180 start_codon:yes stop_codon:yes gene_type:complete